jgi:hypothetical protein
VRLRLAGMLVAALAATTPLLAADKTPPGSQVVLSDKYARPTIINTYFPEAAPLQASPIDGAAFAAEFKRLCLDTGFSAPAFEGAAANSPFRLAKVAMNYPGARGVPAFNIDGWYGQSASARLWLGDSRALRRLPFTVIDAGVMITGPQTPPVPQCNLDVASTSLTDWDATVAAFDAAIGSAGGAKRSRKWAQASWSLPVPTGKIVIGLRIDDLNKPEQTAHVGAVFSEKAE